MLDEAIVPNCCYSEQLFARKHAPAGYDSYKSFKQWIRDEFWFRCIYCLSRETWYPNGHRAFSIDHVIPQSIAPALRVSYGNLVYSCLWCNSAKSDAGLRDPVSEPMGTHLRILDSGKLESRTDYGKVLEHILLLNEPERVASRRQGILLAELFSQDPQNEFLQEKYYSWFGFPESFPDLETLRPPEGNLNEGSEFQSFFALHGRGELGLVY